MVFLRNLLSFVACLATRCLGVALAFGSGLATLRNREKPMVSLRNLLSFCCVSIAAPTRCFFRVAPAFGSGLATLRNREKPMVSLRNLPSFVAGALA